MIDLSNNNALSWAPISYNFKKAYASGQRRVYFKATQGSSFVDSRTPALAKKALAAGFKIGWYHFADTWAQPAAEQARFFLDTVHKFGLGHDLLHCLDMEQGVPSYTKGVWAKSFDAAVKSKTGENVAIYGSSYYLEACFERLNVEHNPLWLAAVKDGQGNPLDFKYAHIPKPWVPSNVAFHQFSWVASIPGIPGKVDLSRPINMGLLNSVGL